jgi:hypothetical protein
LGDDGYIADLEEQLAHSKKVVSILSEELGRRDEELRQRGEIISELAGGHATIVPAPYRGRARHEAYSVSAAPSSLTRAETVAAFLPDSQDRLLFSQHFFAIVLSATLVAVNLALSVFTQVPLGLISLVMSNAPFIFGFWIGLTWRGRHAWGYWSGGIGVALLTALSILGITPVYNRVMGGELILTGYDFSGAFYLGIITFALGPALLYVSGAFVADLLVSWVASQQAVTEQEAQEIKEDQGTKAASAITLALIGAGIPAIATIIAALLQYVFGD